MKIETVEEAHALAGQVFGLGNEARQVTRVENVHSAGENVYGDIYWKRPGGKERQYPVWLTNFVAWCNKINRVHLYSVGDIRQILHKYSDATKVTGCIKCDDDNGETTVTFILPRSSA